MTPEITDIPLELVPGKRYVTGEGAIFRVLSTGASAAPIVAEKIEENGRAILARFSKDGQFLGWGNDRTLLVNPFRLVGPVTVKKTVFMNFFKSGDEPIYSTGEVFPSKAAAHEALVATPESYKMSWIGAFLVVVEEPE